MFALLIAVVGLLGAEPLVLENSAIRVEIDPTLFSVRYVGLPGGSNFIEPIYLTEKERASEGWLDPGGLVTDLTPNTPKDAALRRGPATVLEQSAEHIILLGPESKELSLQFKKEYRLLEEGGGFRYKVTVLSSSSTSQDYALRNMVRIPSGATLRVARAAGEFSAIRGSSTYAVVKSNRFWLVPIPPTRKISETILGSKATAVEIELRDGVLTRSLLKAPGLKEKLVQDATLITLIDDETRSYGVALQGAIHPVSAGAPLVLVEEWRLKKRGR